MSVSQIEKTSPQNPKEMKALIAIFSGIAYQLCQYSTVRSRGFWRHPNTPQLARSLQDARDLDATLLTKLNAEAIGREANARIATIRKFAGYPRAVQDPLHARRFFFQGCQIEFDFVGEPLSFEVARALQNDIAKIPTTQAQGGAEHPLLDRRRACQQLQRH